VKYRRTPQEKNAAQVQSVFMVWMDGAEQGWRKPKKRWENGIKQSVAKNKKVVKVS
jgi:hypothetical protein